jgi:MFS family permease
MKPTGRVVVLLLLAIALAIGTPAFILFGWLSDRIGRKPVIAGGFAAAAVFVVLVMLLVGIIIVGGLKTVASGGGVLVEPLTNGDGRFWRGNLHCHSDCSDGLRPPGA